MSSTESSGAPAEATATAPAPAAAFPSFGSTRGSGLARGKRPSVGPAASGSAPTTEYTPTAIAVVSAPREYQNPFAPVNPEPVERVEAPAAASPGPVSAPVATKPVAAVVESTAPSAVIETEPEPAIAQAPADTDEQAELNILPPEQPKTVTAQTWESEGFRPAREQRSEQRNDQPRRDEARREERTDRAPREESAPFDPSTIPAKFLYVRPGHKYVPTPSNYGGAPRDRSGSPAAAQQTQAAPAAESVPAKSGGIFGWLKSFFGGASAEAAPAEVRSSEQRTGDRHRGGHGRGQGGGGGGGEGQRRRHRGGRGRNQSRGEYRGGGDRAGSPGGDRGGSSDGSSAT